METDFKLMRKHKPCFVNTHYLEKKVMPIIKTKKYNKKSMRKKFYEIPVKELVRIKANL
jgi:hypothetical protein